MLLLLLLLLLQLLPLLVLDGVKTRLRFESEPIGETGGRAACVDISRDALAAPPEYAGELGADVTLTIHIRTKLCIRRAAAALDGGMRRSPVAPAVIFPGKRISVIRRYYALAMREKERARVPPSRSPAEQEKKQAVCR